MRRWRLLLVDDHALFREGLSQLLAYEEDFVVVGHADDADGCVRCHDLFQGSDVEIARQCVEAVAQRFRHRHAVSPAFQKLGVALFARQPDALDAGQQADFSDDAATIETPSLLWAPAGDRPMTPEFRREKVAAIISGSTVEIVEESAHYLPLEQPAKIAARIERFLEEL